MTELETLRAENARLRLRMQEIATAPGGSYLREMAEEALRTAPPPAPEAPDDMIAEINRRAAEADPRVGPDYRTILADVARENDACSFALRDAFIADTITEPN